MEAFAGLPLGRRGHRAAARRRRRSAPTRGLQVDLRVVPPGAWGAALQYFTGSKAHNIRIREIAVRKGLKLSEYGLFRRGRRRADRGRDRGGGLRAARPAVDPADAARGPRRGRGGAAPASCPTLIAEQDIRGDLHTHTDLTDGLARSRRWSAAARARGYAYYAVTDHAPNLYMQRMTDEKMLAQREQLRKLAADGPQMTLLHGTELNIDPDGDVDWGADVPRRVRRAASPRCTRTSARPRTR